MAEERVCVITGASRGIGRAVALRFARRQYAIVAVARSGKPLGDAADAIRRAGGTCLTVQADVADPSACQRAVESARAEFGGVDLLVNNAGVAPMGRIEELNDAQLRQVLDVNIAGVLHMTRAAWPVLRARGGGTIVNLSSMSSLDPFPGLTVYGATKAWVNLFTQGMAAEGRPHGIRVFGVAPGAVETEMLRGLFPDIPTESTLDPDEVAGVVESLALDSMAPATGQTVFVRSG